jgi:hypothetical protein
MSTSRPPVTFALFTYNQEAYVAAAVKAALAQDYCQLEMIISDDASTDRTYEIIRELADRYRGPHQVRLNRNEQRLGIAGHVNRVMQIASGDLLVAAAGDDVSAPHRTRLLVDLWRGSIGKPCLLCSSLIDMANDGTLRGCRHGYPSMARDPVKVALRGRWIAGCTAAWTRQLWDKFGPLPADAVHEDEIMTLWAAVGGSIIISDEPLVCYRAPKRAFCVEHRPPRAGEIAAPTMVESLLRSTEIQIGGSIATQHPAIRDALLRRVRALRLLASIERGERITRATLASALADPAWAGRITRAMAERRILPRTTLAACRMLKRALVRPRQIPTWAWTVERSLAPLNHRP